jgi:methyltransferase family protein
VRVVWESVVEPILQAVRPGVIVEIGVRNGMTTRKLLEFASQFDCSVHGVDPVPGESLDLPGLEKEYGDRFSFHQEMSLEALTHIDGMDAVVIDGDHNWYTVFHELKLIEKRAADEVRPFPTVLLHDVDWPNGRRDRYANINAIPEEYRRIERWTRNTREDRIPRVGVRTAIEDFLDETDLDLVFETAVGFGGVGILVPKTLLEGNDALRQALEHLGSPEWLRKTCRRVDRVRRSENMAIGQLRRENREITARETELRQRLEALEAEIEAARSAGRAGPA